MVPPRDVFMTRGWIEVAPVCRVAIHFEYDGVATLFFKVFNEEGKRLECCPRGGSPWGPALGAGPAAAPWRLAQQ